MIKRRALTNVDTLEDFYDELKEIHMKYFPDKRFGSFIVDVADWIQKTTSRGIGYIENVDLMRYINDYVKANL